MKTPTGTTIVEAMTQILERQNRKGQAVRQIQAKRLLEAFTVQHGLETKTIANLSRLLRRLEDPDAIRQIRSMSDSLLEMNDSELRSELTDLRDQLMPIEARIHQVKTKTAFVSTMLRPFSPKYTSIWFAERSDIDVRQAKTIIEQLEIMKVETQEDFAKWASGVADVFEQVVVYRGEDAADPYARPTGTVSEKSSKTYLQAWNAFLDNFGPEVWTMVGGSDLGEGPVSLPPMAYRRNEAFSYGFEPDDIAGLDQAPPNQSSEYLSLMASVPGENFATKVPRSASRFMSPKQEKHKLTPTSKDAKWIQIFIESKIDSSAQATRKWDTTADFESSIQKWLDTFPVIWGPAAEEFVAKVSVKTRSGESDLTLPTLTLEEAASRLITAVEMQQD